VRVGIQQGSGIWGKQQPGRRKKKERKEGDTEYNKKSIKTITIKFGIHRMG
jgi:hypothetical protein